jgi:hypothetical protein
MKSYFDKFQLSVHSSVHSTVHAEEFPAILQAGHQHTKEWFYTIYSTVCYWASEARNMQKLLVFVILFSNCNAAVCGCWLNLLAPEFHI